MFIGSNLLIVIFLLIGLCLLQVYLSKKSFLLGLILPFITFLYSIVMVMNFVVPSQATLWQMIGSVLSIFLICNIPTVMGVMIAGVYAHHRKKGQELDKMKIKDL